MTNYEIIAGCKVYSYEIKNNDIYGSDINELMLKRKHLSRELDRKCDKFSPSRRIVSRVAR
ncbi:MAG: hypothetical protein KBS59_01005 [Clostridiales bacterium]|nr:hypothetical protein [Clostridiales bacterium]